VDTHRTISVKYPFSWAFKQIGSGSTPSTFTTMRIIITDLYGYSDVGLEIESFHPDVNERQDGQFFPQQIVND
jgi:hypothetical protein